MISFADKLGKERFLVADGAMGTELQKLGLEPGACPEELNITVPEAVMKVHTGYIEAGSDIILTNTFGANRARLKMHGFETRVEEFCNAAFSAAKKCAAGKEILIAGSIGPCGELISPLGELSEEETSEIFREPAAALANAGVDLFVIETMMAPEEALIALRAVKSVTDKPVIVSMSFERGNSGLRTMWGTDIPTAASLFENAGAGGIGANCGRGFDEMMDISEEMCKATKLPVWLKSNAGLPVWEDGRSVYTQSPEFILPYIEGMLRNGANIIGGCCGSTPEHIRAITATVKRYKEKFS